MDGPELRLALRELGWSGAYLARRLGMNPNTISQYFRGVRPAPGYVREYLRVVLLAKEIVNG